MSGYIKWVLTRWYFWVISLLYFLFITPSQIQSIEVYLEYGLKSILSIFLIFIGLRFILRILGKIFLGN